MTITLCGSIQFIPEMMHLKLTLEKQGHTILLPQSAETGQTKEWWNELREQDEKAFSDLKAERMKGHFEKIARSDAILVVNYDKSGVTNYIGGNTLMEMGVAFFLEKKIFLLRDIPIGSYQEEILGLQPVLLQGNISNII